MIADEHYDGPERRSPTIQLEEVIVTLKRVEACQASMSRRLTDHIAEEGADLRVVTDWIRTGKLTAKVMATFGAVLVAVGSACAWAYDHFDVSFK